MKKLTTLILTTLIGMSVCGQNYEWIVDNTSDNPGERVVAKFKVSDLSYPYNGLGVFGQVIDNNGNWGYNLPIVADFRLYINFNGGTFDIVQSGKTYNITLGLKRISPEEYILVANCSKYHSAMRVNFSKVEGSATVTLGNPDVINSEGVFVLESPNYESDAPLLANDFSADRNGNVGIGTSPTISKLTIGSNGKTIGSKKLQNAHLLIGTEETGIGIDNNEIVNKNSNLNIQSLDRDILFKVGETPRTALKIAKNGDILLNEGVSGYYRTQDAAMHYYIKAYDYWGAYLHFQAIGDNGNEKMNVTVDGKIGIATTDPKYSLDVNGTIRAKEVKVEEFSCSNASFNGTLAANQITVTTNGQTADFVFEEDYELRDLQEVETFIKTNKHLPEIPSAAAMEADGVNLAEMNKLLLQKIEELTLYAIEQKAEAERQKAEVKSQNKKVESLEERLAKIEALLLAK